MVEKGPEKFSQEWWNQVDCISGCAKCCPNDCKHLTKEGLCDVHPSLFGDSDHKAEEHGRGLGCHSTPIQLFISDVACPAILDIFEAEGIKIPHKKGQYGVEVLLDYRDAMEKTRELRGFSEVRQENRALKKLVSRMGVAIRIELHTLRRALS